VGNALPGSGNPFTLVERWDGRRWSIERSPNPLGYAELEGVSCPSRMTCTAVGIAWRPDYSRTTIAERWNAGAWMTVPLPGLGPGSDAGLDGVSCTSASACTAVGWGFSDSAGPALVERWNGTRWSLQPTPATSGDAELQGVSCPTLTACTAVGIGAPTIAERWDGMRWAISR
jgi:hypothetical protein